MTIDGRVYHVNGPALVLVNFGAHYSGINIDPFTNPEHFFSGTNICELGLTVGPVRVTASYYHQGILSEDFGPTPAEVSVQGPGQVSITMDLVHYDKSVLRACVVEAQGGGKNSTFNSDGIMMPAGTLLGNGLPLLASGNHFIDLGISSTTEEYPWRFPSAYLAGQPFSIPLGTEKTVVRLQWQAIPYAYPNVSGGLPFFSGNPLSGGGAAVGSNGLPTVAGPSFGEVSASGAVLWTHKPFLSGY